jgi:hypothetical protein
MEPLCLVEPVEGGSEPEQGVSASRRSVSLSLSLCACVESRVYAKPNPGIRRSAKTGRKRKLLIDGFVAFLPEPLQM